MNALCAQRELDSEDAQRVGRRAQYTSPLLMSLYECRMSVEGLSVE